MQFIRHEEVRALVATSPPRPPLNFAPDGATVGPYECPVCYCYKPDLMLLHQGCMKMVCAPCLLMSIDGNQRCPFCRVSLGGADWSETSPTTIIRPPPNDLFWMDKITWTCSNCHLSMTREATHNHNQNCSHEPQSHHHPPSHIPPWHSTTEVALEVVSNHPSSSGWGPATRDKLVIVYCNGRQIFSKFFKTNKTVQDIKQEIAQTARLPIREIQLYKFQHQALSDLASVGDVADAQGATHLAAFSRASRIPNFSEQKVCLVLQEVGCPAYVPPPPPTQPRNLRRRPGVLYGPPLADLHPDNQSEEEW